MTVREPELPLPPGSVLLHIGPQKTGTTAIQGAFHRARRALLEQGVRYAGPNRQSKQAARSLTRSRSAAAEDTHYARRLVREVRGRSPERIVVSAEAFADAEDAAIPHIVEALGGDRVHVAVTLRPLVRILPSQWQQFVQGGMTEPFDRFVARVLDTAPSGAVPPPGDKIVGRFWRRHRHDRLIARWAAIVGPSRVTAIALDDADRDGSARAFEQLVGLRSGTLVMRDDATNRSLTWPEAELLRALNRAFEQDGLDPQVRAGLVPFGIAGQLKARTVDASEARITTPAWSLERVQLIAAEIVAGIRALGVPVLGELSTLVSPGSSHPRVAQATSPADWAHIAATASIGALLAGGFGRASLTARSASDLAGLYWPDALAVVAPRAEPDLTAISTPRISSVIAGRVRSMAGRRPAGTRPGARPMLASPSIHSGGVEKH